MKMNSCKMCGSCCEAIVIHNISPKQWEELVDKFNSSGKVYHPDIEFMIKNWIQITKEEVLQINPFIKNQKKISGDSIFFKCTQLSKETNLCKVHKIRPEVCRKFPINDNIELYSNKCGYIS